MTEQPNRRVLVVDSADGLDVATRALGWRFEVTTCADAEDALKWLSSMTFAAVVCAHKLPGRSGVELLAQVAAQAPDTMRILLTREADLRSALRAAHSAPGTTFVTKPVDPERLLHEVDGAVSQFNTLAAVRRSTNQISSAAEKIRRATPLLGTPVVKKRVT